MIERKISFKNFFIFFIFLWFLFSLPTFSKKKVENKVESYKWPSLPDKEYLSKVTQTKSENGLVLLERNCELRIGGAIDLLLGNPLIIKEEFLRFLVVNENGLKNAETEIETISLSRIDQIEARTILPSGEVILADKNKDIELINFERFKQGKILFSAGKVKFPQPEVGAILDLHYKIYSNSLFVYWLEPLVYKRIPTMKLSMKFNITDNRIGWQIIVLNTQKSDVLKLVKPGVVELNLENLLPEKEEPFSPPKYYYQPYVLAFANYFTGAPVKDIPSNWSGEVFIDDRGLTIIKDINKDFFKAYWLDFLKKYEEERKEFLKRGAKIPEIESAKLLTLPIMERVQKIVEFVQKRAQIVPQTSILENWLKGQKPSLSKSLKDGFNYVDEVTFFISYLFDEYQIPYEKGIILNRKAVRFSPLISNAYVFNPIYALKILNEDGQPVFITGDTNLGFGALNSGYQLSQFISIGKDDILYSEITPKNPKGFDYKKVKFELTINEDETMAGNVSLEERGNGSNQLLNYLKNERIKERLNNIKNNKLSLTKEKESKKRNLVIERLGLKNDKIKIDEWKIVKLPENKTEPIVIEYKVSSENFFNKLGDIATISVLPLIEETEQPFIEKTRALPIWFDYGSTTIYEGTIILLEGFLIEDFPQSQSFFGNNEVYYTFSCEKSESNGKKALKVSLKMEQPLILSKNDYQLIRKFYSSYVALCKSKALIKKEKDE